MASIATQDGSGYAAVNGLQMYYEIRGTGAPLLLLHGGLSTAREFDRIVPALAQRRRIIAVERQGHGHTADIDRPFSFTQWADDTAALLEHLAVAPVDVFGYSTGGTVALELAIRHPKVVRKLAVSSAFFRLDGYVAEVKDGVQHLTADALPAPLRDAYAGVAPHPEQWPTLVAKTAALARRDAGPHAAVLRTIQAPALVMVAERDVILPAHTAELARLLHAEVVVLPNSDHTSYLQDDPEVVIATLTAFLDAPMPAARPSAAQ